MLYNKIGKGYNKTRKADPYISKTIVRLLHPSLNKIYLDIGCGTGNYTAAIASNGFNFWGIDPSNQMLEKAKLKSDKIKWLQGSAEHIPSNDKAFDGAIATLTIHHWNNLQKAFNELFRVLKDKSNIVIFTSTPVQMNGYWLNHYFPEMMQNSIKQMPSFDAIQSALIKSGYKNILTEKYFVQDNLQDLFLYAGKNKPELYFDPMIRNGISSFSNLANKKEVEQGLQKLAADIKSENFIEVRENFKNDHGDYLFVTAEKN